MIDLDLEATLVSTYYSDKYNMLFQIYHPGTGVDASILAHNGSTTWYLASANSTLDFFKLFNLEYVGEF